MKEWTIEIESGPGAAESEETLEQFHDELLQHEGLGGASASMNLETRALAATFQLETGSMDDAARRAGAVFARALEAAGVPATVAAQPWRVTLTDTTPAQPAAA